MLSLDSRVQIRELAVPVWQEKTRCCLKPSKTCIKRTVHLYAPCFVSTAMFLFLFTYRSISYGVDAHAAVPFLCLPVHFVLTRLAIRSPKYLAPVVWLQSLVVTGFLTWSLDGMAYLEAQRLRAAFLAAAEGFQGPVPAAPGTHSGKEALFWQMHADNPSSNLFLPMFMVVLFPPWILTWVTYISSQIASEFVTCSWQFCGSLATLVLNLLVFGTSLALSQNDYNMAQWGVCLTVFCVVALIRIWKLREMLNDVQRHAQELSSQKASQEHADSVLNHVLKNIMVWACAVCQRQESPASKESDPSCGSRVVVVVVEVLTYSGT